MREVWKDIEGFEGYYQVSNTGKIKSLARTEQVRNRRGGVIDTQVPEKIIQPYIQSGYKCVLLQKDGLKERWFVHVLVSQAFAPRKFEGSEGKRKDGTVH